MSILALYIATVFMRKVSDGSEGGGCPFQGMKGGEMSKGQIFSLLAGRYTLPTPIIPLDNVPGWIGSANRGLKEFKGSTGDRINLEKGLICASYRFALPYYVDFLGDCVSCDPGLVTKPSYTYSDFESMIGLVVSGNMQVRSEIKESITNYFSHIAKDWNDAVRSKNSNFFNADLVSLFDIFEQWKFAGKRKNLQKQEDELYKSVGLGLNMMFEKFLDILFDFLMKGVDMSQKIDTNLVAKTFIHLATLPSVNNITMPGGKFDSQDGGYSGDSLKAFIEISGYGGGSMDGTEEGFYGCPIRPGFIRIFPIFLHILYRHIQEQKMMGGI